MYKSTSNLGWSMKKWIQHRHAVMILLLISGVLAFVAYQGSQAMKNVFPTKSSNAPLQFIAAEDAVTAPGIHPQCGTTKGTFVASYGGSIDPPLTPGWSKGSATRAYGCSMSKTYCVGAPKAIPCCMKLVFDIWYKVEEYLVKHNVTYSFRWGSLIFAVRNGMHAPWDGRDIDIGFMFPEDKARQAMAEFASDWNVSVSDGHHIVADETFYKLHHEQYGYPTEQYCFVNSEFTLELDEFRDFDTLSFLGNSFFDFGYGADSADGIDLDMKHGMSMIPVEYDGPNGIKAPRQMFVYPDFYKHLNHFYGQWKWLDVVPDYISPYQIEYQDIDQERMTRYWQNMKDKLVKTLKNRSAKKHFMN